MNLESDYEHDEDDGDYGMDLRNPLPVKVTVVKRRKPFYEEPSYKFNQYMIELFNQSRLK